MVGTGRRGLVKFVLGVGILLYTSSTERQQIALKKMYSGINILVIGRGLSSSIW